MDIACYLPHVALRVYVMGQRGADREPATSADIARMCELLGEALDAGAMGISTFTLMHWGRDRAEGRVPLPQLVHGLCRATALTMGLHDRGLLAPGHKADINVIDFERLALHPPQLTHDLPGGGRRLVQRAESYVATVVDGRTVYREGRHTGELPDRLVRGERMGPG